MDRSFYLNIDPYKCPSPSFVVSEDRLMENLEILKGVEDMTGCRILLAQKGFAMHFFYPLMRSYLSGVCASGLFEAKLGREEFGKEVHTYSPAYNDRDFPEITALSDHIVFNSFSQWKKYRPLLEKSGRSIKAGIRINPEHSEVEKEIYDPCRPGSRLGVTYKNFREQPLDGITGLHFHTLCENNSDSLERTLAAVEKNFGPAMEKMEWINLGGGHHITRKDYDIPLLCSLIKRLKTRYSVEVYLEPGEAAALEAGALVATVLDIIDNTTKTAVLDTSAATHMPDVIEMPYRPFVHGSGLPGEKKYNYIFGGVSCLAGDIIGEYSFDSELKAGDRIVLTDMAHYSMVKTTTFNGVPLPAIVACSSVGSGSGGNGSGGSGSRASGSGVSPEMTYRTIKEFGYNDFKMRLS